jgi:hypothetical protein
MSMAEDIMKKLEQPVGRRSFLRGSSLFAGAVGLGLVSPLSALAQQQQPPQPTPEEKEKEKAKENKDEKKDEGSDKKEVLRDAEGREYRICPQCGYNMYQQGRTWTCENCGYSYVE